MESRPSMFALFQLESRKAEPKHIITVLFQKQYFI